MTNVKQFKTTQVMHRADQDLVFAGALLTDLELVFDAIEKVRQAIGLLDSVCSDKRHIAMRLLNHEMDSLGKAYQVVWSVANGACPPSRRPKSAEDIPA